MRALSLIGLQRLQEFVATYATEETKRYYPLGGVDAWIDSIDEDGHLELGAQFSEDCSPHTIKFSGEDFQA